MSEVFCVNCKHYKPAPPMRWYELFTPFETHRFQDTCDNVSPDLVTGKPRLSCAQWMRSQAGYCGPEAKLFELAAHFGVAT